MDPSLGVNSRLRSFNSMQAGLTTANAASAANMHADGFCLVVQHEPVPGAVAKWSGSPSFRKVTLYQLKVQGRLLKIGPFSSQDVVKAV